MERRVAGRRDVHHLRAALRELHELVVGELVEGRAVSSTLGSLSYTASTSVTMSHDAPSAAARATAEASEPPRPSVIVSPSRRWPGSRSPPDDAAIEQRAAAAARRSLRAPARAGPCFYSASPPLRLRAGTWSASSVAARSAAERPSPVARARSASRPRARAPRAATDPRGCDRSCRARRPPPRPGGPPRERPSPAARPRPARRALERRAPELQNERVGRSAHRVAPVAEASSRSSSRSRTSSMPTESRTRSGPTPAVRRSSSVSCSWVVDHGWITRSASPTLVL